MSKKLKILLMGDASNYHATLAQALIADGHSVTVASAGSGWMATHRDIDLSRGAGRWGGAWLWTRLNTTLSHKLRGYDVVQLCDTSFVNLQPERQLELAKRLKRDNGLLSICALGTNPIYVANLTSSNPALEFSEWHGENMPEQAARWTSKRMLNYAHSLFDLADTVTTALYEYHRVLSIERDDLNLSYTGIPVEVDGLSHIHHITDADHLHIMLTSHPGREEEKGDTTLSRISDYLVHETAGRVKVHRLEPMPHAEFTHWLSLYDIVSDQLYAYTPATTALMAMARGVVPLTGCHPDYLHFIGHDPNMPTGMINTNPETLDSVIDQIITMSTDMEMRRQWSVAARKFAIHNNSASVVADRALAAWLDNTASPL